MRLRVIFLFFVIALVLSSAAAADRDRPRFSDYLVSDVYRGEPARPVLRSEFQRSFRTMIRQGAKMPVQFAGHYTVPRWGCGSGCSQFAIVDSVSGIVYDAPFAVSEFLGSWEEKYKGEPPSRIEFRPDSRLMKVNGCPNERDCGFYDLLMVEGKGLLTIRKQLLPSEYQVQPQR